MAQIMMVAISPAEAGDKPSINTGVSMLGRGGDDFVCGHCGRVMIHSFNMSAMQAEMVFQCGGCGGHNVAPKTT